MTDRTGHMAEVEIELAQLDLDRGRRPSDRPTSRR